MTAWEGARDGTLELFICHLLQTFSKQKCPTYLVSRMQIKTKFLHVTSMMLFIVVVYHISSNIIPSNDIYLFEHWDDLSTAEKVVNRSCLWNVYNLYILHVVIFLKYGKKTKEEMTSKCNERRS